MWEDVIRYRLSRSNRKSYSKPETLFSSIPESHTTQLVKLTYHNGIPRPIPEIETQVLVVGSGPTGATYARKLVEAGIKVLMIDIGAQETRIPGEHKKNVIGFQKNINSFIHVIQGELQPLSIPTQAGHFPNLDPTSFSSKSAIWNGQNPRQNPDTNLDAAAATRAVGGMSNHWTCCTPEPLPGVERPDLFTDKEWQALFGEARRLIHTPVDSNGEGTQFEDSIRQQLVKRTLQGAFPANDGRVFKSMPLACQRRSDNKNWVDWSATATVLGDIISEQGHIIKPLLELRPEAQCTELLRDPNTGHVKGAVVKNLRNNEKYLVVADRYVIAAGAVLTPQILAKSGFNEHLPALGRFLTEQTMTFCQIVLKKTLLDSVKDDPYGLGRKKIADQHHAKYPQDPLWIPFDDYDPQVTQPVTKDRPWHTQVHRDAFSYGLMPDTYDQRAIVDLRWFGYVEPNPDNRVEFSMPIVNAAGDVEPGITDLYGMPQPTFSYRLGSSDAARANDMMTDMINVASKLGGFLPGALPQFLIPGSALHICGTTRAGSDPTTSCVDKHSRVHGTDNLFLAGCSVIPTQMACNPTLTAICFAIVGADEIIRDLQPSANPLKAQKLTVTDDQELHGKDVTKNGITNGTH